MQRLRGLENSLGTAQEYDYVILGAGISGLQAAEILTQYTDNILVLEAQPEFGGRISTETIGDLSNSKGISWVQSKLGHFKKVYIEKGATWIEKQHTYMLKLCSLFQIPLKEQFSGGKSMYLANKESFTSDELAVHPHYGNALREFLYRLDELAAVYDRNVLSASQVNEIYRELLTTYDSKTILSYIMNQKLGDKAADFLDNFYEHTECVECSKNSMHELLVKHARSNDVGILKEFLGTYGHEESYLLEGGSYEIISKYLELIRKRVGSKIDHMMRLNHQVIEVDNQDPSKIKITAINRTTNRKFTIFTKKVICSIPIAVTKKVLFTNISKAKLFIFEEQLKTTCSKSFLIVKTPFWRDRGASGDGLFSKDWMTNMCHEISPTDGSCGILVFFHSGNKYDQWKAFGKDLEQKEREELKLSYLITITKSLFRVSEEDAGELFHDAIIHESSLNANSFAKSGFQSNSKPGTFTKLLNEGYSHHCFYEDQNGIIFLGSEYSYYFASYMEGAIRIAREKIYKELGIVDPWTDELLKKSS